MRLAVAAIVVLSLGVVKDGTAQEQRHCQEAKAPETLPAPSVLLDSARVITDLTGRSVPPRELLFSLVYNQEDSLPVVRRLDSATMEGVDLFRQSLRPKPPTGYWGVRVRVVGGSAPALSLARSVYCEPVPRSIQARPRQFTVSVRLGDRTRALGTSVRFIADADISDEGGVDDVVLLRPSGMREIDDEIRYYVRIRAYHPALLDQTPVPSRLRVYGYAHKVWERVSQFGVQVGFSISMSTKP